MSRLIRTLAVVTTIAWFAEPALAALGDGAQLSTTLLEFTKDDPSAVNPFPKTFTVKNTGTTDLEYQITPTSVSWAYLSTTQATGTLKPGQTSNIIYMQVNWGGVTQSQSAAFRVVRTGTTTALATLTVKLNIPVQPSNGNGGALALEVPGTSDVLTFTAYEGGTAPASQSFTVRNSGRGPIKYTASPSVSWISLEGYTVKNLDPGQSSTLKVKVNPGGKSVGKFTGSVIVSATNATNAPKAVSVTLNVKAAGTGSTTFASINPAVVALSGTAGGAGAVSKTIRVTNTSGASLNWSALAGFYKPNVISWLAVTPAQGIIADGQYADLKILAYPDELSAGSYTASVRFTNNYSLVSKEIPVSLTLAAPAAPAPAPAAWVRIDQVTQTDAATGQAIAETSVLPDDGTAIKLGVKASASGTLSKIELEVYKVDDTGTDVSLLFSQTLQPGRPFHTTTYGPGGYVWIARAVDSTGLVSEPMAFGDVDAVDFIIEVADAVTPAPPVIPPVVPPTAPSGTVSFTGADVVGGKISFSTTAAATALLTKTVGILNDRSEMLDFTIRTSRPWLGTLPDSGVAAPVTRIDDILIGVDPTLLPVGAAGLLTGQVEVIDTVSGSTVATLEVELTVAATTAPDVVLLDASPLQFTFNAPVDGPNPASQELVVTNNGAAPFSWTASESSAWLQLDVASGTLDAGASARLKLSVDVKGLAVGPQSADVTITAGTVTRKATVTLSINGRPKFKVSDASVAFAMPAFGFNPAPHALKIANDGQGKLEWQANVDAGWFVVSPSSGVLEAAQEAIVTVQVNPGRLKPGTYAAALTLTGAGATDERVNVSLTVSAPEARGSGRHGRCGLLGLEGVLVMALFALRRRVRR